MRHFCMHWPNLGRLGVALAALFVCGLALASSLTPFKGWGAGMVVCVNPQPTYVELTIDGSGQSTHLGRFSRHEVIQVSGTGGINGTIDFTAANGDVVSVLVSGQFISGTTAVGTYTITGGTGRFDGATGSATFTAISEDGIHVTFSFNGQIS